ncbi:MAG: carbohydrate-binding protein, partial [Bacteroidales bacterium]|nr:carbohydrate-binding protein [Bacteroidales bacterium]
MKKKSHITRLLLSALFALFYFSVGISQTLPYTLVNNSTYADNQIYIAIVGITGGHVWVDPVTGAVHEMNVSDNTVPGPIIDGNLGPGGNGLYADCFRPLSQIPNHVINIPQISGCRIFISFNSQLFLYFFGYSGSPSGYAAPNLSNPTDPNQGIKFEIIELTYNTLGLWCNTTRVDSYQYPLGLEVWGSGFYKKVGELKTHQEIISEWQATAPAEFQGLLDASTTTIHFPTKSSTFPQSLIQGYIDQIWSKYTGQQLVFNSGDAGTWRGSVSGSSFVFTRDSDGQVATIPGKPTTVEAMEASGVMASGAQWDLVVQAQIAAAINRHAIDLNLGSGVMQNFGNPAIYYQTWPYNWYAKFWHRTDISFEGYTYAFSFDDVFDQSATIHTPSPTNITITIGGFAGSVTPTEQTPYAGVIQIPGTVEMENYDNGGEGVAYHDADPTNQSNTYRFEGVDIEACSEGGYNIDWSVSGEWLEYTVNVASSGSYQMNARVASPGGGSFHVEMDGSNISGTVTVPNTGGWQNWQTVSTAVNLTSGQHIMRFFIDQQEFNTNYISFTQATQTQAPFGGTARAIPGTIQLEDYDTGGEGVAYHDNDASNNGGQYRTSEGVDIEACSEGGYNVGWIVAGEWLEYTVNVASTGTYNLDARVASTSGGSFHIEFNGADRTGVISVPNTGDWQSWQSVTASGISLNAGQQIMRIYMDGTDFNINQITFSSGTTTVPVTGVSISPTSMSLTVGGTQQLTA